MRHEKLMFKNKELCSFFHGHEKKMLKDKELCSFFHARPFINLKV